jgi:hypothetical protein
MSRRILLIGLYLGALVAVIGASVLLARPGAAERLALPAGPAEVREALAADVRGATLHRAHVLGVEPVPCARCHAVEPDGFTPPDRDRCLECHPVREAALHAGVDDDDARQCTRCHDFLDRGPTAVRAWQCAECHTRPHGAAPPSGHLADTCGRCHTPHGEASLAPAACLDCHEDRATQHRAVDDPSTGSCLACHRQHDAAANAHDRCAPCHQQSEPRVAASATFAGGHDRCTTCHEPHGFTRKTARTCVSCHPGQPALAASRVGAHAACTSCHDRHAVKASARDSCQRCHERVSPRHPPGARGHDCLGCHPAHPERDARVLAVTACSSCHRQASGDRAFHRGAACADCHRAHDFKLAATPALCLDCHARRVGSSAAVVPGDGHRDCAACHGRDPHAPARPPACASCHQAQARSAPPGHAACRECHDEHRAALRPRATTCTGCHADRRSGPHAGLAQGCASCHRAHGPGGVARPPACADCHDRRGLPMLHRITEHATCSDCHTAHAPPADRRADCLRCHTDRRDHEPAASGCTGCHPFSRGTP